MLKLRPANKTDVPYITSTWLRTFRDSRVVRNIPNTLYYRYHHKILEEVLPRCAEAGGVLVACDWQANVSESLGDPGQRIIGYLVGEPLEIGPMVHMCYVRKQHRQAGIGKKLLDTFYSDFHYDKDQVSLLYTHHTKALDRSEFMEKLAPYDPVHHLYFLFSSLPDRWDVG
jgi:ribosomal protein S18 acetylase RimI-like enzyme